MPTEVYETTIPASERTQTNDTDCRATGTSFSITPTLYGDPQHAVDIGAI